MVATAPARRPKLDEAVPLVLRPLLRAYVLGYASSVAPRLLTLLVQHLSRRSHKDAAGKPRRPFLESLQAILQDGLHWQRFPAFCAVLAGGSSLLEIPIKRLLNRFAESLTVLARQRLSRWLSTFIAAWLSMRLLQSKDSATFTDVIPVKADSHPVVQVKTVRYAGRTLDLCLFAATRALDVIVGELWSQHRARRVAAGKWTTIEAGISRLTDSAIFATSSALIMWTWIYLPSRLPRGYDKWIASAAHVDARLIKALQLCRTGELRYGEDTGVAPLLQSMCADNKWPLSWGDPAVSVPFPCEIVHAGCGPSCELHAAYRFAHSFRWAMATYVPLNLLLVVRRLRSRKGASRAILHALLSASRSSAFLGAFIALFYYGVCLGRTRLGPRVLGTNVDARQRMDSGVCVGSGCALCGWSILIENAGRRKDMGLFVAPRALATLFPRRYALERQWRETLVFAASTAVVFTCLAENKRRVRGVLGQILGKVLEA